MVVEGGKGEGEMWMVNSVARAASRMKSPTSVLSLHSSIWPLGETLRKVTLGRAGAKEERMRRETWVRGWEGWRRKTVGGGRSGCGLVGEEEGTGRFEEGVRKVRAPRGRMSLNR